MNTYDGPTPPWDDAHSQCNYDIHLLKTENERLLAVLRVAREKLAEIVVTDGIDKGVVLLSCDGPTHYDPEVKGQVYDHENFSPLGDALIDLWSVVTAFGKGDGQ